MAGRKLPGSCCGLTRQHLVLASVNLLLIYMLAEAHTKVKESKERLSYFASFQVVHVDQPPDLSTGTNVFDGLPLKRHVLTVDDLQVTTPSVDLTTTPPDLRKPVNCAKVVHRDKNELSRVKMMQNSIYDDFKNRTERDFIRLTQNCPSFIKTMGYRTSAGSTEEEGFPLAFGIRMHWKVDMAERLLRAIYHPQNVYCIYIDKKSSHNIHLAMQGIAGCLSNVFLASRTDVYMYGSYTAVWGDLQCMRDTSNTNVPWRYYMNLAGQEYPLKTNLELVRMLKLLNGTNDIESYPLPPEYRHRVDYHHRYINNAWTVDMGTPKEPFHYANISLRKGCSYNTFSRAFVKWVLEDPLPKAFINWSKDTDSPDELVWASLNALSQAPGGYPMYITQVAKTFLSREIVWQWGAGYCQGKLIRHICTFSFADLEWLVHRWEFFANKFDLSYDHVILDCLDEDLKRREKLADPEQSIDWGKLKNLPHIKYRSAKTVSPWKENNIGH